MHPHDCCAPRQPPAPRAADEAASAADATAASSYAAGGAIARRVDSGIGAGGSAAGAPAAYGQGRDHSGVYEGPSAGGHHLGRKELREAAGGASAAPAPAAAVRPACTCIWLAEDAKKCSMICPRSAVKLLDWLPRPCTGTSCLSDPPQAEDLCFTLHAATASPAGSMRAVGAAAQEVMLCLPQQPHGAAVDYPPLSPSPSHDPCALMSCPPQFLPLLLQAASPASSNGAAGAAAEEASLLVTRARSCPAHLTA